MSILSALNPLSGLIGQSSGNNYLNPSIQPSNIPSGIGGAAANAGGSVPAPVSSGQVQGDSTVKTPVVPAGPTAAQTTAQNNYNNEIGGVQGSIASGISGGAGDYNQGIQDMINSNTNSQNGINSQAVQNELARDQGLQGVRDMVGNGIQGAGVQIANAGAGTSSAGEAIARDYGIVGRQAASSVGNQYAQGQNTISTSQTALNNDEATQQNVDEPQKKADIITGIVQGATSSLSYLDSLAAEGGISIADLTDQQAQIKAQALAALSAYDGNLSKITTAQQSQPDSQAAAQNLFSAGTAPAQAFNYTTTAPAQFQNTGPSPSSLPIFIAPANKNNDQTV